MTRLEATILHLDDFFKRNNYEYLLMGGVAVILYGLHRVTQDVDITLLVEVDAMKDMAETILKSFSPRKEQSVIFFERYFVLPVTDPNTNVAIDISAGVGGFDKRAVTRAITKTIAGRAIPCCTIEDLILYKLVANRRRDLDDVDFLVKTYHEQLDIPYLTDIAKGFQEVEREDIFEKLKELLA
jgi:hypothetical protein